VLTKANNAKTVITRLHDAIIRRHRGQYFRSNPRFHHH